MRFPNLCWAIGRRGLTHYRVAANLGISETRFSRCISGRIDFSLDERGKLATCLDYDEQWLFEEVTSPPASNRQERTHA